jgi:hypothetical protein
LALLSAPAIRSDGLTPQVREETGVEAKFQSLLCFRQQHNLAWGRSDIYAVCRLRAVSDTIRLDEREIAECAWLSLGDFIDGSHPKSMVHLILRHMYDNPGQLQELGETVIPSILVPNRTGKMYMCAGAK